MATRSQTVSETISETETISAPIAGQLRSATQVAHRNLEQVPLLARLLNHDLSTVEYRSILLAFYHFYAPLEPIIREFAPYSYHSRSQALLTDLKHLDISAPLVDKKCFAQQMQTLPRLQRELAAFASLYVIEGSTAGGQIISRRLAKTQPSLPCEFFNIWQRQPDTWQAWRQWSTHIDQKLASNLLNKCQFDFIIAHANATFNELQAIFQLQSPHLAT
ncbi:biliverdin-producing heme oxygenase [Aliidiomarina haloalkalitolerans]|uniref:biliverdin-producing heme oxygenase n=1 Tax=Aliidiomarina haloalkalitolerans TaxID=859059 RepID=UPI0013008847|nr:biliverdin-producing heme oxygenase [Aliidiomarina haloalkalitolerans]